MTTTTTTRYRAMTVLFYDGQVVNIGFYGVFFFVVVSQICLHFGGYFFISFSFFASPIIVASTLLMSSMVFYSFFEVLLS